MEEMSVAHWGALKLYALCRTNYGILEILRSVVFLFAVAGHFSFLTTSSTSPRMVAFMYIYQTVPR